ncbi:MAG: hypothetical protein Q9196_004223 [Gyalolechia fulgens]
MAIPKSVFAHHIDLSILQVGNTAAYGPSDWENDINLAKDVGIDAFALNIAAQTDYNEAQLENAYRAAESLGFKLFLSFDYAAQGPWSSSAVLTLLQRYAASPAQFMVNGASFVSTFEGPDNSDDWRQIRASVPIYFLPDWTSIGPDAFRTTKLDVVDGAFSWDAWPQGATDKTDESDQLWKAALGSKTYMMPVSPWFYANLPDKNWVWRGDDMWHERWQQVLEVQPDFVEVRSARSASKSDLAPHTDIGIRQQIITWNDYGESHYIGPITAASGIPDGAHQYVNKLPHDHWRDLLPYYIAAYKSGSPPAVDTDKVQMWYRLPLATARSNGMTVGNAPWEPAIDADAVVENKVFFTALVKEPSTVSVQIGSNAADTFQAASPGLFHSSIPFNGRTGEVTVRVLRDGQAVIPTITGAPVMPSPPNGLTNYNAWVGGSG